MPTPLPIHSLGSLLEAPLAEPPVGLWGRWLIPREMTVLVGRGGRGKTTFVRSLMAHGAAGRPFLGVPFLRPLRFLYFSGEGNGAFWLEEMRATVNALGVGDATYDRVQCVRGAERCHLRLGRRSDQERLRATIEAAEPDSLDVVVFDPFARFNDGDELDGSDLERVLGAVADVQDAFNLSTLLVHHASQGGHGLDAIRGHTVLEGYVAAALLLHPDKQSGGTQLNPVKVRYDDGTSQALTLGFDPETKVYRYPLAPEELPTRLRILNAIGDGEFHREADLRSELNISRSALQEQTKKLKTEGRIDRNPGEHGAMSIRLKRGAS